MTTYTAVFPATRRRSTAPSAVFVVGLLALCAVAGLAAMSLALKGPSVSIARSQKLPGIAEEVRTSFGFVEVQHANVTIEPAADAAHAIDVRLAVMLGNKAELPLLFSPAQFELVDARGRVVSPIEAPSLPASLAPNATIGISLHFVIDADAQTFQVRFVDRAPQRNLDISLGALGCVSATACAGAG